MTRKEITGKRDLRFSGWIRGNLPDSYDGFRVSDLDFILANVKTKRIMLLEVKTRGSSVKPWQKDLFVLLHKCIKYGIKIVAKDWEYRGFHCVRFENEFFDDGKILLDNIEMDEESIRFFLSMEDLKMQKE